jgi:hydroxypyruvate isomerase
MFRRSFLQSSLSATALLLTGTARLRAQSYQVASRFGLGYAPHPGMFKALAGPNVIDQIHFAAEQGFTAWEDNGMGGRPPAEQEAIGAALAGHGMTMGVFVAYADFEKPSFVVKDDGVWADILKRMENAVTVAKRCGAKWFTVVPGTIDQPDPNAEDRNRYGGPRLAEGYQTANAIELLRRCSDVLEPHGLTMVLEPLNWYRDHGGVFLQRSDQAYALCKAVDSPSCKILFDIYHQQISEGNLIPNIDRCWDEIAYFQCGDNPGRKEPGTGEINYGRVFAHLKAKGFAGVVGMEHGNSIAGAEGERAVIQAYRDADAG